MPVTIDLTAFGGPPDFPCRGTLQSKRLSGYRLLLLFGERHSLKPFIRDTLLNVIDLDKLGLLSCVGVEGDPEKEIPGYESRKVFCPLQEQYRGNDLELVEAMLQAMKTRDYYFWKVLVLICPSLLVRSIDDATLCGKAAALEGIWGSQRLDQIRERLRRSTLFDSPGVHAGAHERDREIEAKASLQFEQEWAEHEVNVARDGKMIQNLLGLWESAGTDKIAVLNAGSSHQWRIARELPVEISYYHIEQP